MVGMSLDFPHEYEKNESCHYAIKVNRIIWNFSIMIQKNYFFALLRYVEIHVDPWMYVWQLMAVFRNFWPRLLIGLAVSSVQHQPTDHHHVTILIPRYVISNRSFLHTMDRVLGLGWSFSKKGKKGEWRESNPWPLRIFSQTKNHTWYGTEMRLAKWWPKTWGIVNLAYH